MSLSRAELEAMDQDELVETIVGLADRVDDLEATLGQETDRIGKEQAEVRRLVADLTDRVDALEAENERLRARLDGQSSHDKDSKVAQIVQFAQNKAGDAPAVKLDYSDIMGATGCSTRYAYDLMDRLPGEYDWFLAPDEMAQYGSLEIDNYDERRLGVDLEGVHSTGVPLNKFNNGDSATGGA